MNPADYFKEGSEGYIQTKQALDIINAGREAGLPNMDQYENDLKASIALAKQSGWKQWGGFDASRQNINSLVPQLQGQIKSKNEYSQAKGQAETLFELTKSKGIVLTPNQSSTIENILQSGNTDQLKITADQLKNTLEMSNKPVAETQGKGDNKAVELNPFEQERVVNLARMREINPEQLKDPAVFGELAQEVKKRESVETQARKIFRRLQAARELYASPELMNEFGDTKPTQWTQTLFTTGDNALHAALLGQLKGGDLAQGMAEVKAATGTAAGMAVEETKALANSISALGPDLPPEAAQKKLKQVIDDAKFALERLGVDQELIKNKTSGDDVLANKTKYLLPDERKFHLGVSGSSTGNSSSGISTSTERLRAITPQINQSPRTRITGE